MISNFIFENLFNFHIIVSQLKGHLSLLNPKIRLVTLKSSLTLKTQPLILRINIFN